MATPVKPKPLPAPAKPMPRAAPIPAPKPAVKVFVPPPSPEEVAEQEAAEVTAIVPAGTTELAAPGQWDSELEQYATEAAEAAPIPGGNFISTKAGIITINGQEYTELQGIFLDHIFENTLYDGRYVEGDPKSPICFAFARKQNELAPHPDAAAPQSPSCATCPFNAWGSGTNEDGTPSKGKACQNRRRLAIVSANGLTPDGVENADVLYYKTPVTSSKNWDNYVHFLDASYRRPPFAVVTHMSTRPDRKTQYQVLFQPLGPLPDELVGPMIEKFKVYKAASTIMFPYQQAAVAQESEEQAEAPAPAAPPAPRPLPRPAPRKF